MQMLNLTLSTLITLASPGGQPATSGHATAPATAATATAKAFTGAEAELAALEQKWLEFAQSENLDGLMSLYAEDAVLMDPSEMKLTGQAAIRKNFETMFTALDNIKIEKTELNYKVSGNTGFGSCLWRFTAKDVKTGQNQAMTGRASIVAEKRGGKWVFVLDHASIPASASPAPDAANTIKLPNK
jgi:uncharacterized protein (TIGR02246 family)